MKRSKYNSRVFGELDYKDPTDLSCATPDFFLAVREARACRGAGR